jgi:glycerol-3-phosphate acyltransferase PlsY
LPVTAFMPLAIFAIAAYLIGSLSFAVIVSRAFGLPDPHSYGSGNPGATNVLRSGRKAAALLTLLGDGGKGWLAVYLAIHFAPAHGLGSEAVAVAAIVVFLGHLYPVFFGFRGGKGVATALGIMLALNGWLGLAALATWVIMFGVFRISSLSAITAAALAPVYAWGLLGASLMTLSMAVMSVLLLVRHAGNIRRLLSGEEGRVGKSKAAGQNSGATSSPADEPGQAG